MVINHEAEWVQIAHALIQVEHKKRPNEKERRNWTILEALLLKVNIKTRSMALNAILQGWKKACGSLHFKAKGASYLEHLSIP